jgi:hypothetical protein
MNRVLWLLIVQLAASPTLAADSCAARATDAYASYRLAPKTAERTSVSASGDFDGDGKTDTAVLLRPLAKNTKLAAAVCLSSAPDSKPVLIKDIYTAGNLSTMTKGSRHFDYDTEKYGIYERDGINTYCCNCCGATYIMRNDVFVQVVDSD